MNPDIESIYRSLLKSGGHQHWWPGETPLEIAIGAVLTQNTAWSNVEKAIAALKNAGMIDARKIVDVEPAVLAGLIRPSGYYNQKTARLKSLSAFLIEHADGDPAELARFDKYRLRTMLLDIKGIGRETADSIILYAVRLPIFVVDAYTRRIFGRVGIVDPESDYDDIRALFESSLCPEIDLFGDFHAQIVRCAKLFCRKVPACRDCPLKQSCRAAGETTLV